MTEEIQSDYSKYRGRCKELCDALILEDPSLTLTRGHYYDPIWNTDEKHWWCVDTSGNIVDPSKLQFPSCGNGIYTEFNGFVECVECSVEVPEDAAKFYSNYCFCSTKCLMRFVGL